MTETVFLQNVARELPDYLRDESRTVGDADTISFPRTADELQQHVEKADRAGIPLTIQGARTGITAGAVPDGGHILNLSHLNAIRGLRRQEGQDAYLVCVEPGVLLADLHAAVAEKSFNTDGWSTESLAALESLRSGGAYFFPPDPTETSASIGGMVACNASGSRSLRYGATREYVNRLRIMLADGDRLDIERGRDRATADCVTLRTGRGRELTAALPGYKMPAVKNAAGYFSAPNMDLVDLFIGSEGTLGIFTEIELRLIPAPLCTWGITAFLPSADASIEFAMCVRSLDPAPAAIEYFDANALQFLRSERQSNPAFKELPDPPAAECEAVYLEYHTDDEAAAEEAVLQISEALVRGGGNEEDTWLATDGRELARLKDFRHAVPEAVNLCIDRRRKEEPALTKLGTDLAVPDDQLAPVMEMYRHDLAEKALEYVVFGHIGNNHVHVNILPRDMTEYDKGRQLYLKWAQRVVDSGGTVSAEHGIGKVKTAMLRMMYGNKGIDEMFALKQCLDPAGRLDPGNLFDMANAGG